MYAQLPEIGTTHPQITRAQEFSLSSYLFRIAKFWSRLRFPDYWKLRINLKVMPSKISSRIWNSFTHLWLPVDFDQMFRSHPLYPRPHDRSPRITYRTPFFVSHILKHRFPFVRSDEIHFSIFTRIRPLFKTVSMGFVLLVTLIFKFSTLSFVWDNSDSSKYFLLFQLVLLIVILIWMWLDSIRDHFLNIEPPRWYRD